MKTLRKLSSATESLRIRALTELRTKRTSVLRISLQVATRETAGGKGIPALPKDVAHFVYQSLVLEILIFNYGKLLEKFSLFTR